RCAGLIRRPGFISMIPNAISTPWRLAPGTSAKCSRRMRGGPIRDWMRALSKEIYRSRGMNDIKTCMPPDPNLRTPKFKMPTQACDAHCHVFGPANIFPYAPDRTYTPPDAPKQALAILHKTLGI